MVDQTQDEILEVQIKNKQIQYSNDTAKMFDEWLKQCPVKIVGRADVIHGKNSESGLVTVEFYKKVRRKPSKEKMSNGDSFDDVRFKEYEKGENNGR